MKLNGIVASKGIVHAKVFQYIDDPIEIPVEQVLDAVKEVEKLDSSIQESIKEIQKIKSLSEDSLNEEKLSIFDAHIEMVRDPVIIDEVKVNIYNKHQNAAYAYHQVITKYQKIFEEMDEGYIKERLIDIKDISKRVLRNLLGITGKDLSLLDYEAIVVCEEIAPSELPLINKNFVRGIISQSGGVTSHSSIMARYLNIPALVGVEGILDTISNQDDVILDGVNGEVIINPSEDIVNQYIKQKVDYEKLKATWKKYKNLNTVTKDGVPLKILANISSPEDLKNVIANGAEGIGLFRTEFLYMAHSELPTLEEQYEAYFKVLDTLSDQKVVIRTLDIGGDKELDALDMKKGQNPAMGERAIRLMLNRKDIFKTQLKAMLMANKHGNLHIMLPMISTLDEINKTKELLKECEKELYQEDIIVNDFKLGIMVEVPSVALNAEEFAKEVDFFSIGTNDLIQYTMAADRTNESVSNLYQPENKAVIKLITMVLEAAQKENIKVGMCGEMACDTRATEILVKLGLTEFSMTPSCILEIRHKISQIKKHD